MWERKCRELNCRVTVDEIITSSIGAIWIRHIRIYNIHMYTSLTDRSKILAYLQSKTSLLIDAQR